MENSRLYSREKRLFTKPPHTTHAYADLRILLGILEPHTSLYVNLTILRGFYGIIYAWANSVSFFIPRKKWPENALARELRAPPCSYRLYRLENMAENLLGDNPELRPFVLSNVRLTGTRIGAGAYGSVEEVTIPVGAAAKKIHDIFQDRSEIPDDEIDKASTQFVRECQLMSTLRHPNIVQFLGVCFFPGSRLPALVMERLLTSLHHLLDPETQPPPGAPRPLSFFTLGLKCRVLHDVASGLAYLNQQTPHIIHRDLSARNILLNWRLVAKIADLGVARIVPRMRAAATMTKAPGASPYMPPEAIAPARSNSEKSKYDASIDIFSFGVVTIFTVGEVFPCDPLEPTHFNDSGLLVARTELQRRSEYMRSVNTQLRACGQLRGDHPLIQLIQQCLHNRSSNRPNIREVLRLLEEARAGIRDEESERNKEELVRAL